MGGTCLIDPDTYGVVIAYVGDYLVTFDTGTQHEIMPRRMYEAIFEPTNYERG